MEKRVINSGIYNIEILPYNILFILLQSFWPRSLVNRASDSGSEGRAFESHRGHFHTNLTAVTYNIIIFYPLLLRKLFYHD